MKCYKQCKLCQQEHDGKGYRGYECLITKKETNFTKQCPYWNKTIKQINQNKPPL